MQGAGTSLLCHSLLCHRISRVQESHEATLGVSFCSVFDISCGGSCEDEEEPREVDEVLELLWKWPGSAELEVGTDLSKTGVKESRDVASGVVLWNRVQSQSLGVLV